MPVLVAEYCKLEQNIFCQNCLAMLITLFLIFHLLIWNTVNGDRHWLPIGHHSEVEVAKWVGVMLTQNGNSSAMRLRKLWHTDCPSIQGPWTPFTHKNPNTNLVVYPEEKLSEPLDVEQTATEKLIEMFKKQKLQDSQTNELNKN